MKQFSLGITVERAKNPFRKDWKQGGWVVIGRQSNSLSTLITK